VEQHASDNDAWIVVKDKVYDCTPFLEKHPGGSASITMNAGQAYILKSDFDCAFIQYLEYRCRCYVLDRYHGPAHEMHE